MDRSGRRINRRISYSPLPSQLKFHLSQARFKGYSGPIGSGKSQALCQEAIRLSYLNPGRMGLLGAPTLPMLRAATQTTFFEILEANHIPFEYNKSENVVLMKDTGSVILFRPLEQFERLRGTNLAWFGVDELSYCPEEAWLRLEGRLRDPKARRLCGFAVWTPKGFDWVYERFVANPPASYEVIFAKPFENKYLLEKVPDFYEQLRHSYDERLFRQEVLGEYLSLSTDRVYYEFDRTLHVREVELLPEEPILWALDFNVEPMCSIVAQKRGEELFVIDEIVLHRASTAQACEEFLSRYGRHQKEVVIYGDASGHRLQTTGSTDYQVIKEVFRQRAAPKFRFKVPRANPTVRDRIALVNGKLKSAAGETTLWIHPRCKELIKDLERVSYKPGSTVIDKESDPQRTHLSDALGYLIWQEFRPKVGEKQYRLL